MAKRSQNGHSTLLGTAISEGLSTNRNSMRRPNKLIWMVPFYLLLLAWPGRKPGPWLKTTRLSSAIHHQGLVRIRFRIHGLDPAFYLINMWTPRAYAYSKLPFKSFLHSNFYGPFAAIRYECEPSARVFGVLLLQKSIAVRMVII